MPDGQLHDKRTEVKTVVTEKCEERHDIVHQHVFLCLDLRNSCLRDRFVCAADRKKAGVVETLVEEMQQRRDLCSVLMHHLFRIAAKETKKVEEAQLHNVGIR